MSTIYIALIYLSGLISFVFVREKLDVDIDFDILNSLI